MLTPRRKFLVAQSFENLALGVEHQSIYVKEAVYTPGLPPQECSAYLDNYIIEDYLKSSGLDWDNFLNKIEGKVRLYFPANYLTTRTRDSFTVEARVGVEPRDTYHGRNPRQFVLERLIVAAGVRHKSSQWCSITFDEKESEYLFKISIPTETDWRTLPAMVYRFMLILIHIHDSSSIVNVIEEV